MKFNKLDETKCLKKFTTNLHPIFKIIQLTLSKQLLNNCECKTIKLGKNECLNEFTIILYPNTEIYSFNTSNSFEIIKQRAYRKLTERIKKILSLTDQFFYAEE